MFKQNCFLLSLIFFHILPLALSQSFVSWTFLFTFSRGFYTERLQPFSIGQALHGHTYHGHWLHIRVIWLIGRFQINNGMFCGFILKECSTLVTQGTKVRGLWRKVSFRQGETLARDAELSLITDVEIKDDRALPRSASSCIMNRKNII